MVRLFQLVPLNYQSEKAKFFQDTSYNPQFVYAENHQRKQLRNYGIPKAELVDKAQSLIEEYLPYKQISVEEKKLDSPLSSAEIQEQTRAYLQLHNLEDRFQIAWSPTAIARCSIKSHLITFRTGADYSRQTLQGVLNHEIGTHALRRINDENQPWHNHKKAFGFSNSLMTEEGLAIIQQHINDELPILFGAALKYFGVYIAQSASFATTWNELEKFYQNREKLWNTVFRVKRGMCDTSQPGGFTKDLVYFEGAYTVAEWLHNHNFNVADLYLGRISTSDVEKAKALKSEKEILLPFFVTDNPSDYKNKLRSVVKENELTR